MSEQGNGISIERGDLSAEDAERFAAAFRPVWELDEAPFATPTPAVSLSTQDIEVLSAPAAAAVMELLTRTQIMQSAPGPVAASPKPAPVQQVQQAQPLVMHQPASQPPPNSAQPIRTQAVISPSPRTAPRAMAVPRKSADFTDDIVLPKKSSGRGLLYVAICLGALVGVGLAVKFLGDDDTPHGTTPAVSALSTPPPPPKEDTIPPPAETQTAAPAKASQDTTSPPSTDDPPKTVSGQNTAQNTGNTQSAVAPPTPATHNTTPHQPPPHGAEPKHTPPPTPPPTTKPATKSGSGGIVRDNPF